MAYPGESVHVDYLKYLERWSMGDETGPKLSKPEWLKRRQQRASSNNVVARAKRNE